LRFVQQSLVRVEIDGYIHLSKKKTMKVEADEKIYEEDIVFK